MKRVLKNLLVIVVMVALITYIQRGMRPQPVASGTRLPPIKAEGWLNGEMPTSNDLAGKLVVIDFFATWCGPCLSETPELVQLQRDFANDEVRFLALTTETAKDVPSLSKFVTDFQVPWPIGYGAFETSEACGAHAIPLTILVDRQGNIVWNSRASADGLAELRVQIQQALAARPEHPTP